MNQDPLARIAGNAEVVADHTWPGTSTTVTRLRTHGGREMILKTNTNADSFARELHALRTWAPALGPRAPQLLDADPTRHALLTTVVPGVPLSTLSPAVDEERSAYRQAGALLRFFHNAGPRRHLPTFGPDRAAYIRAQLAHGTDPLTPEEADTARHALELLDAMPGQQAQPSHLDFTSRNLLWDGERLGVIDFETSRYEAVGRDFLRIRQRTLNERPDLYTAFHTGYGREPDTEEGRLIRVCEVTDAAAIAVTATRNGQLAFATEAHRTLHTAFQRWPPKARTAAADAPGP
ncbi:aminoglycoside phosphotransferase family protein [Embleya sp. NPDC008237]|uniref:aminoglycoside phosphotransferase family protein n=1 Tax=Embleya sp. NPDC008237 TaxID=3363978 RepID=UPI0036E91145